MNQKLDLMKMSEARYMSEPDNAQKLEQLKTLAQQWGGEIRQITKEQYQNLEDSPHFSTAPFTVYDLGVCFDTKVIYFVDTNPPWPNVLHEMGHVFACKEVPIKSQEFEFFGWEYMVAQQLDGIEAFLLFNRDYAVTPDGDDLGALTALQLVKVLVELVGAAYSKGLIVNGTPQAIR